MVGAPSVIIQGATLDAALSKFAEIVQENQKETGLTRKAWLLFLPTQVKYCSREFAAKLMKKSVGTVAKRLASGDLKLYKETKKSPYRFKTAEVVDLIIKEENL